MRWKSLRSSVRYLHSDADAVLSTLRQSSAGSSLSHSLLSQKPACSRPPARSKPHGDELTDDWKARSPSSNAAQPPAYLSNSERA